MKSWTRREFATRLTLIGSSSSLLFWLLPSRSRGWRELHYRRSFPALGTLVNISLFGVPEAVCQEACRRAFAEIACIQQLMSTHDPDTQLSRVNRSAGRESVRVDPRILEVIDRSLKFSRQSKGVFDVTTLPLLRAWGFRDYRFDRPPEGDRIEAARALVDYQQVVVEKGRLGLLRTGAEIDLGGIAKGYAIDRAVSILRGFGIERALVEAGGDLYALGTPPDSTGWEIGLKDPRGPGLCARFQVRDRAVATSGISESFVSYRGKRYGHLFDPFGGRPVEGYVSTTVAAPSAIEADAFSTTVFVMGRQAQPRWRSKDIATLRISLDADSSMNFDADPEFPECVRLSS